MCTAVLSIEPGLPLLLAGVRDEFSDRPWQSPHRHWPHYQGLVGGRDLQAGGTWLAVSPEHARLGCVLNARGPLAPAQSRRSRGVLPLQAAAGEPVDQSVLSDFDPFHLLTAEPGGAFLQTWNGAEFTERKLGPGVHIMVNSGLASDLLRGDPVAGDLAAGDLLTGDLLTGDLLTGELAAGDPAAAGPPATERGQAANGREHEIARLAYFLPRFGAAARPDPQPGLAVSDAWGDWFPLVNGDRLGVDDQRALIVRRDLGGGRIWGTTSVSLVALWATSEGAPGVRYDFTGAPGDPAAWNAIL